MIRVELDNDTVIRLSKRLSSLAPQLLPKVSRALRPMLQKALEWNLQGHWRGCGRIGGSVGRLLTYRTGRLYFSVVRSLQMSIEDTVLNISIGSDVPYAAIHEYGGYAGRRGPFKKRNGRRPYIPPRPYLHPTMKDLEEALPGLLDEAIQQVRPDAI